MRETSYSNSSTVYFVADVESNQECGDLLHDARVFQLAAIDRPETGDLRDEFNLRELHDAQPSRAASGNRELRTFPG